MSSRPTRRQFLAVASAAVAWPFDKVGRPTFRPLESTSVDTVSLVRGLSYRVLMREGDRLAGDLRFGSGADFVCAIKDGYFVNHAFGPTKSAVGFSIVRDTEAKRANAMTPMAFDRPIAGATAASGTLANRGGALTPWGTVLSCEASDGVYPREWPADPTFVPEHYGWIVEVDPTSAAATKRVALGRYCHGPVIVSGAANERCVVYSGHARPFGCLYKLIADVPGSLSAGTLYVANLDSRRWEPLRHDSQPTLQKAFRDQNDVLVHAATAAEMVGGSRLDTPAGLVCEGDGRLFVSLAGNAARGNHDGSLVRLVEESRYGLTFEVVQVLGGGAANGFAVPGDLAIDGASNVYVTTSGSDAPFGGSAIYMLPGYTDWHQPLRLLRIAAAPKGARFTGLSFAAGTMLVSVQYPERERQGHWPGGGDNAPLSASIAVSGDFFNAFADSATD